MTRGCAWDVYNLICGEKVILGIANGVHHFGFFCPRTSTTRTAAAFYTRHVFQAVKISSLQKLGNNHIKKISIKDAWQRWGRVSCFCQIWNNSTLIENRNEKCRGNFFSGLSSRSHCTKEIQARTVSLRPQNTNY